MVAATLDRDAMTVTVKFKGKFKQIEVRDVWGDGRKLISNALNGVVRHRTGKKVHPVRIEFWLDRSASGKQYVMQGQYCVLNRQSRLIGWLEDFIDSPDLSLH